MRDENKVFYVDKSMGVAIGGDGGCVFPGWQNREGGGISPAFWQLPTFLTGIKKWKWKMGLFAKIVDQIRGDFKFGGRFGESDLPPPRSKIRGDAPGIRILYFHNSKMYIHSCLCVNF